MEACGTQKEWAGEETLQAYQTADQQQAYQTADQHDDLLGRVHLLAVLKDAVFLIPLATCCFSLPLLQSRGERADPGQGILEDI